MFVLSVIIYLLLITLMAGFFVVPALLLYFFIKRQYMKRINALLNEVEELKEHNNYLKRNIQNEHTSSS